MAANLVAFGEAQHTFALSLSITVNASGAGSDRAVFGIYNDNKDTPATYCTACAWDPTGTNLSLTNQTTISESTWLVSFQWWEVVAPAAVNATLKFTCNGDDQGYGAAFFFDNVNQSTPSADRGGLIATSEEASRSDNVTNMTADDVGVDMCAVRNYFGTSTGFAPGGSQTTRTGPTTHSSTATVCMTSTKTGTGTMAMSWSWTLSNYHGHIVGRVVGLGGGALTEKYSIPTNASDGIQRRLFVWSDLTMTTLLVNGVTVTATGGFFKYTDPAAVVGVERPAVLTGFGASSVASASGGPCWALGIEE